MTQEEARAVIQDAFLRSSYSRVPSRERRDEADGSFKKGHEVRLVARNETELAALREAIEMCGFPVAKAFSKHGRWVQPIYGRAAVEWRARWLGLQTPDEIFRGYRPGGAGADHRQMDDHRRSTQASADAFRKAKLFLEARIRPPLPEPTEPPAETGLLQPFSRPRRRKPVGAGTRNAGHS